MIPLALASPAWSAQIDHAPGTGAFGLHLNDAGARGLALGAAGVVMDSGPAGFPGNPAGLAESGATELSLSHQSWLAETAVENAALRTSLGRAGNFGLGATYVSYGSFEILDDQGRQAGTFDPNEYSLALGWGRQWSGRFSAGASAQILQQNILGSSEGAWAASAGARWFPSPDWRLGAALRSQPRLGAAAGAMGRLDLGAAFMAPGFASAPAQLALAVRLQPEGASDLQAAAESGFMAGAALLGLRAGYRMQFPDQGLDRLYGLTAGGGIRYGALRVDYAFWPGGDFDASHLFSLGWEFGAGAAAAPPELDALPAAGPAAGIKEKPEAGPGARTGAAAAPDNQDAAAPPPLPGGAPAQAAPAARAEAGEAAETFELPAAASSELAKPEYDYRVLSEGYLRGEAFEKNGAFKEAVQAYVAAVTVDRGDLSSWRALARLYERLGRRDYALQAWRQVWRSDPGDPEAHKAMQRLRP